MSNTSIIHVLLLAIGVQFQCVSRSIISSSHLEDIDSFSNSISGQSEVHCLFLILFITFEFSEQLHCFKPLCSGKCQVHASFLYLLYYLFISFSNIFISFLSKTLDVVFFYIISFLDGLSFQVLPQCPGYHYASLVCMPFSRKAIMLLFKFFEIT